MELDLTKAENTEEVRERRVIIQQKLFWKLPLNRDLPRRHPALLL